MHHLRTGSLAILLLSLFLFPFPSARHVAYAAPSATCISKWTPVPMPAPPGGYPFLRRVAASASDNIWAVGQLHEENVLPRTLIEHWNGSEWAIVPSPNVDGHSNQLDDIAVVNASDAWAIGSSIDSADVSHLLIQHWDGNAWSIVATPLGLEGDGRLISVSATTGDDVWAVGTYEGSSLILHWNGSEFQSVPSPFNGSFTRVIAKSSNDVWALGEDSEHYATLLHWDGSAWAIITSFKLVNDDEGDGDVYKHVESVSDFVVPEADAIWVAGRYFEHSSYLARVWHWDGTSWSDSEAAMGTPYRVAMPSIAGTAPDNLWRGGRQGVSDDLVFSHRTGAGWTYYDLSYFSSGWQETGFLFTAVSNDEFWAIGPGYPEPEAFHGTFTCTAPPSEHVTLVTPAQDEIITKMTPTFVWQNISGTGYYNVEVKRALGGTYSRNYLPQAPYQSDWGYLQNGEYSWRVQACNFVGCGEWSEPVSWTRQVPTPETPQLLSPPTGASIASDSVSLRWTAVSNANHYTGELYQDSPTTPPFKSFDLYTSSIRLDDLTEGSYSWHIKACGPGGCSDWSDMFEFDIFHPAPVRPTLLIPKAKATVKTRRPWLGWSSSGTVLYYRLQLRKDSRGGPIIDNRTVHYDSYYHWQGPLSNGVYYWRVKACNEFRCSKWTKGRKFFVDK